jgi:hypothetical protein
VALLVAGSGVTLFSALGGGTDAGWQSARIVSSTDTVKSARLSFTHTYAATTCSGTAAAVVTCPGSPVATGASSSTAQDVSDVVTNSSTTAVASAYTEQVRVDSCHPAQLADARGGDADPMLPRHRVARQVGDPWGTASAASFDGVDDYAADIVATSTAAVASTDYSVGVWFRATAGSGGGGLLSLNASPVSTTSWGANPTLYLDADGLVRFNADGVLGVPMAPAPSTADLRDDAWHLAVVTVSHGASDTVSLYLDGSLVSSTTGDVLTGTATDAFWHLGWTDTTALAGSPRPWFVGSLSGAFFTQATLTPAAVAGLHGAGSASTYAAAVAGPGHVWMLGDPVTSTYAGPVGFIVGGDPCAEVVLSWTLGATPAFGRSTLASLEGATWRPATAAGAPDNGSGQTLTTSYASASIDFAYYDPDVAGMELLVPLSYRVSLTDASGWAMRFDWPEAVLLG